LVRLRSHAVERRPGWDQAGRSDAELWALADRLQARVETLERLLDAAQPEWRNKP
jgi:phage shock protein B